MQRLTVFTWIPGLAALCLGVFLLQPCMAAQKEDPPRAEEFSIRERGEKYRIHILYPSLGNASADAELADWAKSQATVFMRGIEDLPVSYPFELGIRYRTEKASSRVSSVIFTVSAFMGEAHEEPGLATFVYDLATGRRLSFIDIFREQDGFLRFLSRYCRADLEKQLGGRAHQEMLASGTEEDIINFDLFSLDSHGLVIHFPPYQVAPYSEGYLSVHIPLKALVPFSPYLPFWDNSRAK